MSPPAGPSIPRDPHLAAVWLAAIIECSDDAIISKDLESRIHSWNPAAEKIFGYTAAEMIGTSILRLIPPDRQEEESMILRQIRSGQSVKHFETRRLTKAGRQIDVSVTASPIRDAAGEIVGVSKIARDITAFKEREREVARMTRLYAALSQVNQAIVMTPTRDALLAKVCRVLVDFGGFRLAWIGWEDPATHRLMPVARWGDDADYTGTLELYTDDRPSGRGPSGLAFRSGQPFICNDLLRDPAAQPWWPEMERRGLRAAAVFPVRCRNEVCGTLNVYATEPGFFQDKEVALLLEAACDLSFGLDNFERAADRERAERLLRAAHEFSEAILNGLPGVLYLYDRTGKFLRWNRNFETVTGYSAAEIAAMHPLDFFAGPDKALVAARIETVFAHQAADIEAGLVAKDGRVTPYYFTGVATQFEGGTCLVGVGLDISARVAAEEARRVSEARYRTLFDYAPDGIVITDAEGNYRDANPSLCRLLGYARDELVGMPASRLVVPEELPHVGFALSQVHRGSDYHCEWRFLRRDGSVFPAEVIATLMPDGNIMGMIRDITERKQAEAALREAYASLEQKVALRTEELSAALLRAEAADRIKSAFLAAMSHELRTPLNSIIGFTGIVLQGLSGPLTPEQSKQLGMVRSSAHHLLELINDVLDLSKIEAGQLEIRREPFEVGAVVERAVATVRLQADKKRLTIAARVPEGLPPMVSDSRRLEQILLNLLNNAVKFTDRGEVSLTVERVPDWPAAAAPVPALRFSVTDTGIGIKAEDREQLFQPFRQIDSGLTRLHEGTGLGLAICRRLAGLMGGTISVASEWGRGSVFVVTLPLRAPLPP